MPNNISEYSLTAERYLARTELALHYPRSAVASTSGILIVRSSGASGGRPSGAKEI